MFALYSAVVLFLTALNVQASTRWCDSVTNICFQQHYFSGLDTTWSYLFPPAGQSTDEFIGMYTAPIGAGWVGSSLSGGMTNSLLVVGWMDGGQAVLSTRISSTITTPDLYRGPTLTALGTSGVNSTHQRIVYRCQNCTTWTGGSLPTTNAYFGWAIQGSLKPDDPSDPDTTIYQHTVAGGHDMDVPGARSNNYQAELQQLIDLIDEPTPTTTTTSQIPTPTGPLSCPGAPQPSYAMVAASGFRATAVLGRLTQPRGIAIDSRDNLLVVERGRGISHHTLDSSGCVTSTRLLISDSQVNHGIDVFNGKLYASSATTAWVWDYNADSQSASNKRTIITGMYSGGTHFTRTVWISRQSPDYLVVSHGSNSNIDIDSYSSGTGRAIVKVFDMRSSNSVNYASGGRVLGYGLRNDVAIIEDRAGNIVSVENSMDDAYRTVNGQRVDVHNDNPAEIVWNLGSPSNPSGAFHGYPYCFFVWEPSSFRDTNFQVSDWFVQEPTNSRNDAWCSQQVSSRPLALLPPHSAPLDAKFGLGDDTNLYVGLHGSWNRNPPQGYKVVRIPGRYSASGEWSASVSLQSREFEDILTNVNENACIGGCFRPVGLAWRSDGNSLYVASDTSGEVFLVQKNGGGGPITTTTTTTTTSDTSTTTTTSTTTSTAPEPTQTLYGQCGGNGYTGPTKCATGSVCRYQNDWYSQCVPG